MSEETVTSPFTTVPAQIECMIGKRKRKFASIEEAQAALDRFNNGPTTQNKGIQAARKAAKAVKEAILLGIQTAYPKADDVKDQAYKIRCTVIAGLCTARPEVYFALTGVQLPVVETPESDEGGTEGTEENVDSEASSEGVVESAGVESGDATDPLSFLD